MFHPDLPLDPFANDPNDPAKLLDDDDPQDYPPITDEEIAAAREDLQVVNQVRGVLSRRGVLGAFFMCDDCSDFHFYSWDLLVDCMKATIAGDTAPIHEHAPNQDTSRYVSWEYLLGYADGMRLA
ncbi:DUF5319 family protein [Corynebacterium aquilae]|uniref:DUF5319 family protein n=1 Tax=Corynebacterium aquilae TaxID=203263 RepID=UPI0012EDA8E9|nr:DUF5319 family protein [Corynebacterium aquilae]